MGQQLAPYGLLSATAWYTSTWKEPIVNINLHLTDDTQLRAHGFVAPSGLFAEVYWDAPLPASRLGEGILWGTPEAMRRLAARALQAAIQAEEEACWQAHEVAAAIPKQGRVA
jgi:hypothetical protein